MIALPLEYGDKGQAKGGEVFCQILGHGGGGKLQGQIGKVIEPDKGTMEKCQKRGHRARAIGQGHEGQTWEQGTVKGAQGRAMWAR